MLLSSSSRPLRWDRDGRGWPLREFSRFVEVNGIRWHVQVLGEGPPLLLLHGAGAASHSFRDLAPLLAESHQVLIPDLPGHGFTVIPDGAPLGLRPMARSVAALMRALDIDALDIVGHSAGAAVGARMALDGTVSVRAWAGINPALFPLQGWAAVLFAPAARAVASSALLPRVVAWSSGRADRVQRTIEGTGSRIDARGVELYTRLVRSAGHVAGTVRMMAEWDLETLVDDLDALSMPMLFILAEGDRAVAPEPLRARADRLRHARVAWLPELGHLAHEEAPQTVATQLESFLS